ncbi:MAG: NTP transferase domain-containing protein [Candidatus Bipolaricaulia bacterium]
MNASGKGLSSLPGIILAAGEGSRFGKSNKLLVPFRGEPVIRHVVRAVLCSKLDPVILVTGYESERAVAALGEFAQHSKLQIIHNERWRSGRTSSVRAAIDVLPDDAPGAVFLQADMPLMDRETIDAVVDAFLAHRKLCFPVHQGRKGHPTALPRDLLSELYQLWGDTTGFALVNVHWDEAIKLRLKDERTQFDLDTEVDYRTLHDWEKDQSGNEEDLK